MYIDFQTYLLGLYYINLGTRYIPIYVEPFSRVSAFYPYMGSLTLYGTLPYMVNISSLIGLRICYGICLGSGWYLSVDFLLYSLYYASCEVCESLPQGDTGSLVILRFPVSSQSLRLRKNKENNLKRIKMKSILSTKYSNQCFPLCT